MTNSFFSQLSPKPIHLTLSQDRVRSLKRGYPWVFAHSLVDKPKAQAGSLALLKEKDGTIIAKGMYDPNCHLAFRVCTLGKENLNDEAILIRLKRALEWRKTLFGNSNTNAYRLFNGEGDGLPGLVCDVYGESAIMQLDGDGPFGFWQVENIALWLKDKLPLRTIFLKPRSRQDVEGRLLYGEPLKEYTRFLENGIFFEANLIEGQKSGFFLDQRDNRQRLGKLCKDKSVLNLFGYTGGFSVYAGVCGASHVTTVDIAKPAIEDANKNWAINNLPADKHLGIAANVFPFLDEAKEKKQQWDVVVVDPPSFAPSKDSLEKAKASYQTLIASAVQVTKSGGIITPSSCSSHITPTDFIEICEKAISDARRQGQVLGIYGQPEDHPFPLVCKELQYLKFDIIRIN